MPNCVSDSKATFNLGRIELIIKLARTDKEHHLLTIKYINSAPLDIAYETKEERDSTYEKIKFALTGGV